MTHHSVLFDVMIRPYPVIHKKMMNCHSNYGGKNKKLCNIVYVDVITLFAIYRLLKCFLQFGLCSGEGNDWISWIQSLPWIGEIVTWIISVDICIICGTKGRLVSIWVTSFSEISWLLMVCQLHGPRISILYWPTALHKKYVFIRSVLCRNAWLYGSTYLAHRLVPNICVSESGQRLSPSHYSNQCWVVVNLTRRNQLQCNYNQNSQLFFL